MRVVPFKLHIPLPSWLADRIGERRARQFAEKVVESIRARESDSVDFAAKLERIKDQAVRGS